MRLFILALLLAFNLSAATFTPLSPAQATLVGTISVAAPTLANTIEGLRANDILVSPRHKLKLTTPRFTHYKLKPGTYFVYRGVTLAKAPKMRALTLEVDSYEYGDTLEINIPSTEVNKIILTDSSTLQNFYPYITHTGFNYSIPLVLETFEPRMFSVYAVSTTGVVHVSSIYVSPAPHIFIGAVIGPFDALVNRPYSIPLSIFNPAGTTLFYTVSWGDNSEEEIGELAGDWNVLYIRHRYEDVGANTIVVIVYNEDDVAMTGFSIEVWENDD